MVTADVSAVCAEYKSECWPSLTADRNRALMASLEVHLNTQFVPFPSLCSSFDGGLRIINTVSGRFAEHH